MPHIARSRRTMLGPGPQSEQSLYLRDEFKERRGAAGAHVVDVAHCPRWGESRTNASLDGVRDIGEVTRLLSIAVDARPASRLHRLGKDGDDAAIGAIGVL